MHYVMEQASNILEASKHEAHLFTGTQHAHTISQTCMFHFIHIHRCTHAHSLHHNRARRNGGITTVSAILLFLLALMIVFFRHLNSCCTMAIHTCPLNEKSLVSICCAPVQRLDAAN